LSGSGVLVQILIQSGSVMHFARIRMSLTIRLL
jgi:hypothetical protein